MDLPQFNDIGGDIGAIGIVIIAVIIGLVAHWAVWSVAERAAARTASRLDESFLLHTRNAARFSFVVVAIWFALALMAPEAREYVRGIVIFLAIIVAGWFLVGLTRVGYDAVLARYPQDGPDSLEERQMKTQITVLDRFGTILIWLVTVALALLTIPGVAPLAASLLAGAGVLGIVLGVAAGPLIGNLIAGVQIAFTQPIKVGDVVVIGGEWGTIGEITAAYVVVYIWDRRRLIVPLSDIVNKPVENWTRRTTDLLATVKLHLDYRTPVEAIRAEFKRILDESDMWDGEAWSVLVTESDDRSMVVRVLFSSPDSGNAWDLRCLVRERLIAFLQKEHPYALPVAREIQVRGPQDLAA
jgi:small-conductance mechanosensitive channel